MRFLRPLYGQVLIAILLGGILGHVRPDLGLAMKPLADGFLKLIKALTAPLLFTTLVAGIGSVGDLKKVKPVPFGNPFEPAARGWIMGDRSVPGHIGDPRHASAEKGEALFQVFTDGAVSLLERVLKWDGKSGAGVLWKAPLFASDKGRRDQNRAPDFDAGARAKYLAERSDLRSGPK